MALVECGTGLFITDSGKQRCGNARAERIDQGHGDCAAGLSHESADDIPMQLHSGSDDARHARLAIRDALCDAICESSGVISQANLSSVFSAALSIRDHLTHCSHCLAKGRKGNGALVSPVFPAVQRPDL